MVATLYHHDHGIAPPFVAPTPHEMGHHFVEPIALGRNGNVLQAKNGMLPGAVLTTGAGGSTSVALASILGTRGIDWG